MQTSHPHLRSSVRQVRDEKARNESDDRTGTLSTSHGRLLMGRKPDPSDPSDPAGHRGERSHGEADVPLVVWRLAFDLCFPRVAGPRCELHRRNVDGHWNHKRYAGRVAWWTPYLDVRVDPDRLIADRSGLSDDTAVRLSQLDTELERLVRTVPRHFDEDGESRRHRLRPREGPAASKQMKLSFRDLGRVAEEKGELHATGFVARSGVMSVSSYFTAVILLHPERRAQVKGLSASSTTASPAADHTLRTAFTCGDRHDHTLKRNSTTSPSRIS